MLSVYLYSDHAHVKRFENCTDHTDESLTPQTMFIALNKLKKITWYLLVSSLKVIAL